MTPITDGTVKFIVTKSGGVLPGTVTAFSGTFNDGFPIDKNTGLVNREWHLCDGTNGTPDLRSRFIYGGDGTNNGATGGEASHKLTEAELPAVSAKAAYSAMGTPLVVGDADGTGPDVLAFPITGFTKHSAGGNVVTRFGGNQPHNNMPPYYVLAYIMKM